MGNTSKYILQVTLISFGLILCIFLFGQLSENEKAFTLSKPNYLGMAQMGLIPTKAECSHSIETYDNTRVYMEDKQDGNKYVILQSKFGDESCLARMK